MRNGEARMSWRAFSSHRSAPKLETVGTPSRRRCNRKMKLLLLILFPLPNSNDRSAVGPSCRALPRPRSIQPVKQFTNTSRFLGFRWRPREVMANVWSCAWLFPSTADSKTTCIVAPGPIPSTYARPRPSQRCRSDLCSEPAKRYSAPPSIAGHPAFLVGEQVVLERRRRFAVCEIHEELHEVGDSWQAWPVRLI